MIPQNHPLDSRKSLYFLTSRVDAKVVALFEDDQSYVVLTVGFSM